MKTIIDGMNVGYTDQGEGTPLVFIHAFPLSKTMWQPQVEALKEAYRVITIDLGGHGDSDIVPWNDSLDGYAKNIIRLLDHLEITQAVFVGLSMGGYTLFSIYRHYANRVKAMVLADTRAQADSEEGRVGRQSMAEMAFKDGTSAIADIMLPKLLAPSTTEKRHEIVEDVRQMILETSTAGIVVDLVAMATRPDSTDLLTTITCPTLVIVGEEDQATPVAEAQYMVDRISVASFVTIPQAGHLSNFEQPFAFNQAIQSFLKTHGL